MYINKKDMSSGEITKICRYSKRIFGMVILMCTLLFVISGCSKGESAIFEAEEEKVAEGAQETQLIQAAEINNQETAVNRTESASTSESLQTPETSVINQMEWSKLFHPLWDWRLV